MRDKRYLDKPVSRFQILLLYLYKSGNNIPEFVNISFQTALLKFYLTLRPKSIIYEQTGTGESDKGEAILSLCGIRHGPS